MIRRHGEPWNKLSSTAHKQTAPPDKRADIYDDGHLRVEYSNYYVSCGRRELALSRKEFLIVSRLARDYGKVVAFANIWVHAWGENVPYNRVTLRVQMHRVRRLLDPFGLRVESEGGVGYALRGPTSGGGGQPDSLETKHLCQDRY